MTDGRAVLDRRTVLRGLGALGLLAAVPGCAASFAGRPLALATGVQGGSYISLGTALAAAWTDQLGLDARVQATAGSVDNLQRLAANTTDVAFSQVDTAVDQFDRTAPGDPRALRALARIYDDVVHVVVPASSPAKSLGDLRGARVSIGEPRSGYSVIARRLLTAAGLSPEADVRAERLGLRASAAALRDGRIDAFFWSGALPSPGVTDLATTLDIRLLDLDDVLRTIRADHPEYASGTVPAGSYAIEKPISTLFVRNFLLVGAEMADDLAYALVDTLFRVQGKLALVTRAALTIDLRAAIGTQPVPLHPGAERYYREAKDS